MQRNVLLLLLSVLVFSGMCPHPVVGKEENQKVAIASFDAEKAGQFKSIKDALKLMLSGRLASREGITLVGSSLTSDEKAAVRGEDSSTDLETVFDQLDVDYIGAGEMLSEGPGLRLKMKFTARDGRASITVSTLAADQNQVLAAVDTLAGEIARKVFGLEAPQETVAEAPPVEQSGVDAFRTEHPDRKYKEEIISGAAVSAEGESMEILQGDMLRRRTSLGTGVVSLSVADMDSDGVEEIAVVSKRDLRIYRYDRGLVEKIDQTSFANTIEVHAMNLADLDGDGIDEIYISAVDDDRFGSIILTWTRARGFQLLAEDIRWAIRPLAIPGEGYRLIGQDRSVKVVRFFEPGLHYIDIDYATGDVLTAERLFVPKGFNLFDFTFADLDGDALYERVAITRDLRLVVYDHQNRLLWAGTEDYGGRNLYLGDRWLESESAIYGQEVGKHGEALFELQYIPVLPLGKDIDGDGSDEILVARNTPSMFKELTNLRSFSDGRVVCLRWDGSAMQELWSTDSLDGHVASFDVTSNPRKAGEEEPAVNDVSLYVGQIAASGFGGLLDFFGGSGNLIVYDFGIVAKTEESPEELR